MSLHKSDWAKLIGGALLVMTGAGAAGVGPLAAAMGSGAGAAGAGAAGAGAGSGLALASGGGAAGAGTGALLGSGAAGATGAGFGSLIAPSLVSTGLGTAMSGAQGTQGMKMTSPSGVPTMTQEEDPFAMFQKLMSASKGGMK